MVIRASALADKEVFNNWSYWSYLIKEVSRLQELWSQWMLCPVNTEVGGKGLQVENILLCGLISSTFSHTDRYTHRHTHRHTHGWMDG